MPNQKRQLLVCVSNAELCSKISAAARECMAEVQFLDRALLCATAAGAKADCLIVEFETFNPEACELIDDCRRVFPETPIVAVLDQASATDAGRFTRFGVFECLATSAAIDEVSNAIELAHALVFRARAAHRADSGEAWRRHLVGESLPIDQVTRIIRLIASRRCTVLIGGETGTGKEMAARAIHLASDRARKPMVSINCSAIPENLIEAELFGHVKGAFTGAVNHRVGRFEQANGGTLFLDEIGDLPIDLQAKLLRVLQEREIQRLGSSETVKIDVRVIAATNADLLARVRQGQFREDLYYRLNVVPVHMPALRDRKSDVGLLAQHFVQKICQSEGLTPKEISTQAIDVLTAYQWPGNVRQLENLVEHAVIMAGERNRLYPSDFAIPRAARQQPAPLVIPSQAGRVPDEGIDYGETLRQFERGMLQQALDKAHGNKTLAADMLRLPRTTLLHKLRVLEPATA
jgi:DNA-binding NtrC family response regulator